MISLCYDSSYRSGATWYGSWYLSLFVYTDMYVVIDFDSMLAYICTQRVRDRMSIGEFWHMIYMWFNGLSQSVIVNAV